VPLYFNARPYVDPARGQHMGCIETHGQSIQGDPAYLLYLDDSFKEVLQVKLPTTDEDAVLAFEREALINGRIASFGGMSGVAEYLGWIDLSLCDSSLLPANVGGTCSLSHDSLLLVLSVHWCAKCVCICLIRNERAGVASSARQNAR